MTFSPQQQRLKKRKKNVLCKFSRKRKKRSKRELEDEAAAAVFAPVASFKIREKKRAPKFVFEF